MVHFQRLSYTVNISSKFERRATGIKEDHDHDFCRKFDEILCRKRVHKTYQQQTG